MPSRPTAHHHAFLPATHHPAPPEPVVIFDVAITPITLDGLLAYVKNAVERVYWATILYGNIHTLNQAYRDRDLRQALAQADMVYCDGAGVRWGARLLGKSLPERMTGADWIYDLAQMCRDGQDALFLLGGAPSVADAAAERLWSLYPELNIVGTHHGFFSTEGPENEAVIQTINRHTPHILLVGLGTPVQEKWISRNRSRLNVPVVWAMGGTMDFVSGRVPRAPRWMCQHSLEWLFRLLVEPQRLWKRYLIGNTLFFWRVLQEACR